VPAGSRSKPSGVSHLVDFLWSSITQHAMQEQRARPAKHAVGHSIPVRLLLETSRVVRAERFPQLAGSVPAQMQIAHGKACALACQLRLSLPTLRWAAHHSGDSLQASKCTIASNCTMCLAMFLQITACNCFCAQYAMQLPGIVYSRWHWLSLPEFLG
jgi:hypothetical protein